jgi:hypothetical protein
MGEQVSVMAGQSKKKTVGKVYRDCAAGGS